MRPLLAALILLAAPAMAQEADIGGIVDDHILPGYQELASESAALSAAARADCRPGNPALTAAYHNAFDAWIGVSHLRFGPSEEEERAFALAFWPDPRGATPGALSTLIRGADPVVEDPAEFATVSVAARGFYALEFLLFDPAFAPGEAAEYHCALTRAVSADIAANSAAILAAWQGGYGALMRAPGNDTYRSEAEVMRQLFTALLAGLEFTADARLGRPLGTFERPRPNRAEARRSHRSLRHVRLSLEATAELAAMMTGDNPEVAAAFDRAIARAEALDDPTLSGVADPQGRFRVEALQQDINDIRTLLAQTVGPALGIAAGFNSLDGD